MNILFLLHQELHSLGFIPETHSGRQAGNHPCVPRQALARAAPDGVELPGWGWRRSAWEAGWGAGCIQMHTLGTWTAVEGTGAGIHTLLTFPCTEGQKQDVNGALSPPGHRTAPGSCSPTTGVTRGHLLIAHSHTGQPCRSVTEEASSFQSKTAGRGLARWMVNCSNWNYAATPRHARLHFYKHE